MLMLIICRHVHALDLMTGVAGSRAEFMAAGLLPAISMMSFPTGNLVDIGFAGAGGYFLALVSVYLSSTDVVQQFLEREFDVSFSGPSFPFG